MYASTIALSCSSARALMLSSKVIEIQRMDVGDSLGVHDWKLLVVEALYGRERLVQEVRQLEA